MDKLTKKYLEKMLEGCEAGIEQINEAVGGIQNQLDQMSTQKEEMETAAVDLRKLLGVKKGPKAVV
jgi:prefoldin subunit 5